MPFAVEIPAPLRTIARRHGYELRPGTRRMPIEACRIGSNLVSMNFANLDKLVGWLDLHDRAAA